MQHLLALAAMGAAVVAVMVAPAFAASPGTKGQPSQSCLSSTAPMEPGNAASAPGSAFRTFSDEPGRRDRGADVRWQWTDDVDPG